MLQPSGYMTVSSYDNVKPLKTGAAAIRRWGRAVVGREGVEGRLYNILKGMCPKIPLCGICVHSYTNIL